jgi:ComF family protein
MLDIFSKIVDTLFPLHESVRHLKVETTDNFVRHFSPHRFANCIALSDYNNPTIKDAITANKFHDFEKAADLLSTLVEHWLQTLPAQPTILVPIPLSPKRLKSRGYNQVLRVLEKTQNKNVEIIEDLLIRSKETRPQTSLNRDGRFKNMEEAFIYMSTERKLTGYRIVIIDDVVTTGATMHVAQSTLRMNLPENTEIICVALAH